MTEKTLETKLRERVKNCGGLAVKVWAVSFTGLPDRLILMPGGRAYFAEIKTLGQKPKPHQEAVHGVLRKLGFAVAIIDSVESFNTFMELITKC